MSAEKPVVEDMLGQNIEYVRSRPYQRLPIIETGTVKAIMHYKNEMFMLVSPDSHRCQKWVSEYDFRSYVRNAKATTFAVAS